MCYTTRFSLKYCNTSTPSPPSQSRVANIKPNIQWGRGKREVKFTEGNVNGKCVPTTFESDCSLCTGYPKRYPLHC